MSRPDRSTSLSWPDSPSERHRLAADWFGRLVRGVDDWDAPAFDPDFEVDSLESFEPEVTRVFTRPRAMV